MRATDLGWPSGGVVLAPQNALFHLKCVTRCAI